MTHLANWPDYLFTIVCTLLVLFSNLIVGLLREVILSKDCTPISKAVVNVQCEKTPAAKGKHESWVLVSLAV